MLMIAILSQVLTTAALFAACLVVASLALGALSRLAR